MNLKRRGYDDYLGSMGIDPICQKAVPPYTINEFDAECSVELKWKIKSG
jgi:hypothetical protein